MAQLGGSGGGVSSAGGGGVIPVAMTLFAIALCLFGGLAYGFYEYGTTWAGGGFLLGLVLSLFILNVSLKKFFNAYTGRLMFAMWLLGILGSYGFFLFQNQQYPMGIDLAGGTELIYRLDFEQSKRNIASQEAIVAKLIAEGAKEEDIKKAQHIAETLREDMKSAPDHAAEILRRRVDPTGTKGIPVTTMGRDKTQLRIQLPKATPEEVKRIETAIMTQGRLTFHIVAGNDQKDIETKTKESKTKTYFDEKTKTEWEVRDLREKKTISDTEESKPLVIRRLPDMQGSHVAQARARRSQEKSGWEIEVTFDGEGSAAFANLTGNNIGRRLAVNLDGVIHTAPTIQSAIAGVCQITGNFSEASATEIAGVLKAGSLPAQVVQENKLVVGPSLGTEQINAGMKATFIGSGLVILFMLVYYRMNGAIAAFCTLLGLLMQLGLMGFFKATLTLPGIAGIVLTLGMSVDANVLILERLREELARGRPLRLAVSQGFDRAFITIIDCHMTTLLSSVILYYLGSGPVRGFAVSLSIGVLTTLFCNLWLNWILTEWLVSRDAVKSINMMQIFKVTNIDFMGSRKLWMTLTGSTAVVSAILFAGFSKYDVDFTGGTVVQFNFIHSKERSANDVREVVEKSVRKGVLESAGKVLTELKGLTASNTTGLDLQKLAIEKLPVYVDNLRFSGEINADTIKAAVESLEGGIDALKQADLSVQGCGTPVVDKYRSFSVTTRIVDPIITLELKNQILETFKADLELEEVSSKGKSIFIRLYNTNAIGIDAFNGKLQERIIAAAKESSNREIKKELESLKTVSITPNDKEYKNYYVAEIGDLPADKKQADSVLRVVELMQLESRAGGPISRVSGFGSQVASDLKWQSLAALILANLAVFIYVWFRFDFSAAWGFGAIVALVHDVVIAAGAVTVAGMCGFPILFNLNIIAALLTIIGFSVNDTIVVFDRIREVKHAHPTRSYEEIVNEAINATLSRTILTSLTVLIAVISLLIFGGPTIQDMAFTLLIGFGVGTYSSIFIASPLMIWWYKRFGTGRAPVPGNARNNATSSSGADASKAVGAQI